MHSFDLTKESLNDLKVLKDLQKRKNSIRNQTKSSDKSEKEKSETKLSVQLPKNNVVIHTEHANFIKNFNRNKG